MTHLSVWISTDNNTNRHCQLSSRLVLMLLEQQLWPRLQHCSGRNIATYTWSVVSPLDSMLTFVIRKKYDFIFSNEHQRCSRST